MGGKAHKCWSGLIQPPFVGRCAGWLGFVELGSNDEFQFALARVSEEGNVAYRIDFIKENDKWKYNGHVIN